MNPSQYSIIYTRLLMMLGLSKAHAVFLSVAILVREDYHQILARVVSCEFIWQTLDGILVRDGSLTG